MHTTNNSLTLSWWRPLSYRNQSIDLFCKSMDWFLYDNGLRHERVKTLYSCRLMQSSLKQSNKKNSLFLMGIIFCSSVVLVWTFNIRGVYNFITKKVNIPLNLVPFYNGASLLPCRILKSGITNEQESLFLLKAKESVLFIFFSSKL